MFQTVSVQKAFNSSVAEGINGIKGVYRAHEELNRSLQLELHTLTERALQYAKDIFYNIIEINHKARRVDLSDLVHDLKDYSFYR